jgi:hypothetical protein
MRNLEVLPDLAGWNRTEVLLQVLSSGGIESITS